MQYKKLHTPLRASWQYIDRPASPQTLTDRSRKSTFRFQLTDKLYQKCPWNIYIWCNSL